MAEKLGEVAFDAPPGWQGQNEVDSGGGQAAEERARRARIAEYEQLRRETTAENAAAAAAAAEKKRRKDGAERLKQRAATAAVEQTKRKKEAKAKASIKEAAERARRLGAANHRRREAEATARSERGGRLQQHQRASSRSFGSTATSTGTLTRSLTRSGTGQMVSDSFLFGTVGSGGMYKLTEGGAVASKIKPNYRGVIINGGPRCRTLSFGVQYWELEVVTNDPGVPGKKIPKVKSKIKGVKPTGGGKEMLQVGSWGFGVCRSVLNLKPKKNPFPPRIGLESN